MSLLKRIYIIRFVEQKTFREIESILGIPSSTLFDYVKRLNDLNLSEEYTMSLTDEELQSLIMPKKLGKNPRSDMPDYETTHIEKQKKSDFEFTSSRVYLIKPVRLFIFEIL